MWGFQNGFLSLLRLLQDLLDLLWEKLVGFLEIKLTKIKGAPCDYNFQQFLILMVSSIYLVVQGWQDIQMQKSEVVLLPIPNKKIIYCKS
jgi:hypothetical protein